MSMIEKDRGMVVKHQGTMLFNALKVREQTTVELIHEVHIIGDC